MVYYPARSQQSLVDYLKLFPVVSITGPRQAGKSTLLKHELGKQYGYVTFDDLQLLAAAEDDPVHLMSKYNSHIIFDEIQKAPNLLSAIKINVDVDRQSYGKFIITGSNQLLINQKVSETLAGRIGLLTLCPLVVPKYLNV